MGPGFRRDGHWAAWTGVLWASKRLTTLAFLIPGGAERLAGAGDLAADQTGVEAALG
jgi:hypothetical protein